MKTYISSNTVKDWATRQFQSLMELEGVKRERLTIQDMKDVREIAFSKFGYFMNVAEDVAKAFKSFA